MSGFGDPYRHPRDDRGARGFDQRDERAGGGRGRGGHGGGRGGFDDGRRGYDDRGYGTGGGRGGRGWDDDGGRDSKRGRYEDHDRARGSPHGRDDYHHPPPPQHGFTYQPHAQPAYPPQQQHHQHQQPSTLGYAVAPGAQVEAAAAPPPRAKGPVQPEPVSASVIFLGLPPHAVDIHLRQFLENMGASVDSTTVIMDRSTNVSKGFGFAKFSSVEHARAFVEPNFPSIPWREPSGPAQYDGMRVKINYSQKSGGWREDQGASARLTEDLRKAEGTSQSFYVNDGTRDIGSAPSSTLLLRGLDPLTGEDEIFSTLARVGGRANQEIAKGGVRRVMVAKDRASRSSWGFAFVQFADVRLATDVLGAIFNPRFHPAGFRIRSAIVAASFAHENSFIPVYAASTWSFRGDGGTQLAYWDDKGWLSPWTPPPPVELAKVMQNVPKGPRAHEEAKAEADLAAFFDDLEADLPLDEAGDEATTSVESAAALGAGAAAASAATSDMATSAPPGAAAPPAPSTSASPAPLDRLGSTAPISIKPISSATAATVTSAPSAAVAASSGSSDPSASKPGATAAASAAALGVKEKKADLIARRKAAPNIAKWNDKAKEIRKPAAGAALKTSTAPSSSSASTAATAPAHLPPPGTSTAAPAPPPQATPASSSVEADDEFAHGDPVAFVCLLCQRQFKGTNLANADTVTASTARKAASLKKHAASPSPAAAASQAKPKYVDRAAARRDVHGAIDEGPVAGSSGKKRKFDGPEPPAPAPAAPNKDGLEESNAGRKMLEKMGWTSGAGLGATGDGRVAPVQAAQFQQGAGLGSTKGVAVGEDVPTSHAERMRLKAVERFEK
ncbi:hypothetical protein JCM8208_007103 [Rhodotorula glutinis]